MNLRKRILTGIGALAFVALMAMNVQLAQNPADDLSESSLTLSELAARADSGSGSEMTCFSVSSKCTWWGCSYVTICGNPCVVKQVDSWSNEGTCPD